MTGMVKKMGISNFNEMYDINESRELCDKLLELDEKIKYSDMIVIDTIKFIDNPTARKIKYKDVRKINIGIDKKDLISQQKYAPVLILSFIKKITDS